MPARRGEYDHIKWIGGGSLGGTRVKDFLRKRGDGESIGEEEGEYVKWGAYRIIEDM